MERSIGDTWVDSQMKMYEPLWDELRAVRNENPSFLAALHALAPLGPKLERLSSQVQKVEHQSGLTLDAQNLEEWIRKASKHLKAPFQQCFDLYTSCGIDVSTISIDDLQNPTLLQASPVGQKLQNIWGPKWLTRFAEIHTFTEFTASNRMEESKFMALIAMRSSRISNDWRTIQGCSMRGELADFRQKWAQSSVEARIQWLEHLEFKLPKGPSSDIYAWFQTLDPENTDQKPRRELFLTPALNLEQLSQDDMLPRILEQRASGHPESFRTIDGGSINLGLWCRCLTPISTEGVLLFAPQSPDNYNVSIIRETNPDGAVRQTPSNSKEALPYLGIYQLEAQQRTYRFLAKCLEVPFTASSGEPMATNAPSLLAQSARLDCQSQHTKVDIEFLGDLVQSSLEEVLDNLCRLRTDPEYWVKCMTRTVATPPGRVYNFLKGVFDRIQAFSALTESIRSLRDSGTFTHFDHVTTEFLADHSPALQMLRSLHNDFSSLVEEWLSQLSAFGNPIAQRKDPFFSWLFNLLKTNDPLLRIAGIPAVLTAIDHKLEHLSLQESGGLLSVTGEQWLNDMSIFSVGFRESFKHWNFATEYHSDIRTTEVVKSDQQHKSYPWSSLIQNALAVLSHDECHKLQVHIQKGHIEAAQRHWTFWTLIDKHMLATCQDSHRMRAVYDYIQRAAPLQDIQVPTAHAAPSSSVQPEPTATQLKRSKGRKTVADNEPYFVSVTEHPETKRPPLIRPEKDLEFWRALLSSSTEDREELDWCHFCRAMEGIGYSKVRQGGSGRRFKHSGEIKLGTIVFHEPHGTGKVTHRTAQQEWLKRIRKRFQIQLE